MNTVPGWVWAAAAAALVTVIGAEIALTARPGRARSEGMSTRQAAAWVVVYVSLAVVCTEPSDNFTTYG